MRETPRLCIFGAGSVGCYIGGRLARAGATVTLVGRPYMAKIIRDSGLTLSDSRGYHEQIMAPLANAGLSYVTTPAEAGAADLVLVTVKSAGTRTAALELEPHLAPGTAIVSFQNGVGNADLLRQLLPKQTVLAGMVPFNVLQQSPGHFHQGTEGALMVAPDPALAELEALFGRAGLPLELRHDMTAVLWGKLLLNLNNPINALADIPLKTELSQRDYRRCLALAQRETLDLLTAAGIRPAKVAALPPQWLPAMLSLPDFIFARLARRMLAIDPIARSSMWEDLQQGRKTEIDFLNGAVLDLARRLDRPAPVNQRLVTLIHTIENGSRQTWSGESLLRHLAS